MTEADGRHLRRAIELGSRGAALFAEARVPIDG